MIPFKLLIHHRKRKNSSLTQKPAGFTLIELLVAMILASLILTPLLGFMINILQTERREQAKTNTEQELKSALDFIARDLEQAVYIYDADGIDAIRTQLPKSNERTKYFPTLVFWKRQYIKNGVGIGISSNRCKTQPEKCDDTFSYSLVAYYLIKDNNANSSWSNAARIGRFQISDGYGSTDQEKNQTREAGFQLFDLTGIGDLKTKMNKWKKGTYTRNTPDVLTLVDYIDQTPINTTTNPAPKDCPEYPDPTDPTNTNKIRMQQIPKFTGTGNSVPPANLKTASFYVCVSSENTLAEVHLRGNAFARIENTPPSYNKEKSTYFPQARIRVEGRGFVFTK
ncbi:MAG: hormogonium polysaccharide secretion pseudopilin HpsC [Cyanobacteriota bacterium]|nr:hormogonium polysaccharide secretion pseudopilin HpsC [Cyanobacteriota bacterium]